MSHSTRPWICHREGPCYPDWLSDIPQRPTGASRGGRGAHLNSPANSRSEDMTAPRNACHIGASAGTTIWTRVVIPRGERRRAARPLTRLCAGGLGGRDLDFGGGLNERQQLFVQARREFFAAFRRDRHRKALRHHGGAQLGAIIGW